MSARTLRILLISAAFLSGLLLCLGIIVTLTGRLSAPVAQQVAAIGGPFRLVDHNGREVTEQDFKGKPFLVFFGFTHCPDVCPTALFEISEIMRALGPDAEKTRALFITVDPERDTPELLRQYVPSFNPAFLGLYGTAEETAAAAKEFKVYVQKQPQRGGGYSVDHSAGTFVLDKAGRLRLFGQYGAGAKALLHDIRLLLKE
jgi:protein SCO1/2